jgi:hypothetical protein
LATRWGLSPKAGAAPLFRIEKDAALAAGLRRLKIAEALGTHLQLIDPLVPSFHTAQAHTGIPASFADGDATHRLLTDDIQNAKEIRLPQLSGWRMFGMAASPVRYLLEQQSADTRMRVLLLNPHSPYVPHAERLLQMTPNSLRHELAQALAALDSLRRNTAAYLIYKVYDELPLWQLLCADGVLWVGSALPFLTATSGGRRAYTRIEKPEAPFASVVLSLDDYFEHRWDYRATLP